MSDSGGGEVGPVSTDLKKGNHLDLLALVQVGGKLLCGLTAKGQTPAAERQPCDSAWSGRRQPGVAGALHMCWVPSLGPWWVSGDLMVVSVQPPARKLTRS